MDFELIEMQERYRPSFVDMHADCEVMRDLGGPICASESNSKFDRYIAAKQSCGTSRWAVVDLSDQFLGYCGVVKRLDESHPLKVHYEIGWRFDRRAWGKGFATNSASKALEIAWSILEANVIYSYTASDNFRSQNVMRRLALTRRPDLDFEAPYPEGNWSGLVWEAIRPCR